MIKGRTKKLAITGLIMFSVIYSIWISTDVKASDVRVYETNVTEASDGNVLVGVPGTFYSTTDNEMLDLMNEVRKEAYDEHLEYPKGSGKHLGVDYPYVPLKWSSQCEQIARIRAAEVCLLAGHARPSGKSTFLQVDNFSSNGEVIAWNSNVLNGIRNKSNDNDLGSWYGEKQYYVDSSIPQDSSEHVQGHYIAMINPNNTYVGISSFKGSYGIGYLNGWQIIVGEFSDKTSLDSTFNGWNGKAIHKVEVKADYVSMKIDGNNAIHIGDKEQFEPNVSVRIGDYGSDNCDMYTDVEWKSSDVSVLSVNAKSGEVDAKSAGEAVITATVTTGDKTIEASLKVVVLPNGVEIQSLVKPETIEINTGTKPSLPEKVKALLSNGETIDVAVVWEDMEDSIYSTNSYRSSSDTTFDVQGTFQDFTVLQTIKVTAMIDHFELEENEITVDSGVKPTYPKATRVYLTNGAYYSNQTLIWTDNDVYKNREGGTYIIEGTWSYNKTKNAQLTLIVNPATITDVSFDETEITTASGMEPVYPKATVTWSNGDTSEEDIVWEENEDFISAYKKKAGTTYIITGTYNGETTSVKVTVKSKEQEESTEDEKTGSDTGSESGKDGGTSGGSTGPSGGNTETSGGSTEPSGGNTETSGGSTEPSGGNTETSGGSTEPSGGDDKPGGTHTESNVKIQPAKTSISKLSAKKKTIIVKWKKATKNVKGYQIQYSLKKDFKNKTKTVNVSGYKTTSKTIKKLKAKKKYYVRIRTYYSSGNNKWYSSWSKVKSIKTK